MKRSKKNQFLMILVSVILVAIFIVSMLIQSFLSNLLPSQNAAKRWGNDTSFSQVTAFIPEHTPIMQTDIENIRQSINQSSDTKEDDEDGENWTDAYSAEGTITVSREDKSAESAVTAVGGNYFVFHPVKLISGAYFSDDDVNYDLVILDKNLAWRLFGSTDVVGMEVEINNKAYVVSGVFECEDDFASKKAYGDEPRIYMSYTAYEKAIKTSTAESSTAYQSDIKESGEVSQSTGKITMYMALLPNPVKNYGLTELKNVFEGNFSDTNYTIIENSTRYSPLKLLDLLKTFGERSMNKQGISYPYWENAARMVEDYSALLMLVSILVLIFPIVTIVMTIIKLWSNKQWTVKDIAVNLGDKILRIRRDRRI